MRVFFSAGEASGDAYAAELMTRIRSRLPETVFEGIGGRKLAALGCNPIDSSAWGSIGIPDALRVGRNVLRGASRAKKMLSSGEPGLMIPIDFGFLNIRLAKYAKDRGWKVLYFIPPGSWKRHSQGSDLPGITDLIVTPFSWSADILNEMGANARWLGHPLLEMIGPSKHVDRKDQIAVLVGSRRNEISINLPILAGIGGLLPQSFEFAVAPTVELWALREAWSKLAPHRHSDTFTEDDTYGVFRRSQAAIVCSGTATLEAALLDCPMAIFYKVSTLTALQAVLLRMKPRWAGLPNILLQRDSIPEFVQDDATPEKIVKAILPLMLDSSERREQLEAFNEIRELLGPGTALTGAADLACQLMSQM